MSITDELRAWIERYTMRGETYRELLAIVDRIDAKHEKAVTAAHSNSITKYGSMVAREYVKLPVDADGVPIRIGDIVALRDEFEARQLVLVDKDLWVVEDRFGKSFNPDKLHHVKPDTWEDIIEDAMRYARETNMPYPAVSLKGDELVERCRRLAGEE